MPHRPTRSPPSCVPGVAGTTPHQQLKAWQPRSHTLGKPQHNEVTHRSTRHAAATRYTLLHWKQALIVEVHNLDSMSFCFRTSATSALLVPGHQINSSFVTELPIEHSQVIQVQGLSQQCLHHRKAEENEWDVSF